MKFKEWILIESKKFDYKDIENIAKKAKLNISNFDEEELVSGVNTEKEHMSIKKLDVIEGHEERILKIALAHLEEDSNYYKKLKKAKL
jgi:hypothetical protein